MKEGSGIRVYAPKHNGLRAKLLAELNAHPGAMLTRAQIMERWGVAEKTVTSAIKLAKRDGQVRSLYGPNRIVHYVAASAPTVKLPKPAKPIRDWPSTSSYTEPRTIPTSIFHYAEML